MKSLRYAVQSAVKSIWKEKWINFLAVLSISISLSVMCLFIVLSVNLDSLLQTWSKSFGIVAYLAEDISKEDEHRLKRVLSGDADIVNVTYISKQQAFDDVRETLGDNAMILNAFRNNPLPSSFELSLDENLLEPKVVKMKATQIEKLNGIRDVQYGEKWLSSLYTVSKAMKIGYISVGFMIFVAITFITYSTIKIFFYRRQEEIETLKLLGATKWFIKLPFLIEGIIIGVIGGSISALALFGVCSFTAATLTEFLPYMKNITSTLPLIFYLMIPACGAFMSMVGSFIAVGRIKY